MASLNPVVGAAAAATGGGRNGQVFLVATLCLGGASSVAMAVERVAS